MNALERFVQEDLGSRGDVTTKRLFGRQWIPTQARVYARERVVAAGILEARDVFQRFGVRAEAARKEGTWVAANVPLLALRGPLQGILGAERLALNFLGRMCGIATTTRLLSERVLKVNPRCRIAATRKTTPGFRYWEKRAVALGGGERHRMGLFDAVLIKDNHVAALGGDVAEAVRRACKGTPRLPVEVEVSTVSGAEAAVLAGADWILVDNLSPAKARVVARRARRARGSIRIEVSGGLKETNLHRYAPFADRLSLGRLTHSARSADVTLDLVAPKR